MPRGGKRAGAGRPRKPQPQRPALERAPAPPASSETAAIAASAEATTLGRAISRAKDLTLRLLAELDVATAHVDEIEAEIWLETAGDRDPRRRNAMLKAVSMPTRAGTLRTLLAALRAWAELELRAKPPGAGNQPGEPAANNPPADGWDFVDEAPATKSVN